MTIEAALRLAGTSLMGQSPRVFRKAYATEDFPLTPHRGGCMHLY